MQCISSQLQRNCCICGSVQYVNISAVGAESGVTDINKCVAALQAMADAGVLLLVHGEVTDPDVDMFDREAVFIETKLVSSVWSSP